MQEHVLVKNFYFIIDKLPENQLNLPYDEQDTPSYVYDEW